MESTFVNICLQPYFLKSYKDFLYMGFVVYLGITIDQDVVNVGNAKFI